MMQNVNGFPQKSPSLNNLDNNQFSNQVNEINIVIWILQYNILNMPRFRTTMNMISEYQTSESDYVVCDGLFVLEVLGHS